MYNNAFITSRNSRRRLRFRLKNGDIAPHWESVSSLNFSVMSSKFRRSKDRPGSHFKIPEQALMGVIVLIDTRVDNNDESGLEYFAKSLVFNSQNIGSILNIIGGFGLAVNNHKNIEMLDLAIRTLEENHYNFTESEQEMIARKLSLKNNLIQQIP